MVTKRGKQASRKAAARKYGFLAVPIRKTSDQIQTNLISRSLSDFSDRSEQSGKARTDWPDFEAHSHSMQRKIRVI
ncbi:MAG: hypothetical protein Q8K59_05280 [Nitrosomonas sp.]|nr:hypothetical protein [Nitrosomonas sp.]MDP1950496.1 hypothetical protein [Nitrosomonas sp.]